MARILALCLCMLLSTAAMAAAGDVGVEKQVAAPLSGSERGQMAPAESVGDETSVTKTVEEDEKTADPGELKEDQGSEAKEMSGMSIVGNEEAPKSLYIVPWKSSEIGVETSLDTMLNEGDVPVDREVFRRQIEFYRVSTGQ